MDVLNDILGDTVGHDEFQEELENTEKSTVAVIKVEKPKSSKAPDKTAKKKTKKPTSSKKSSPIKPSTKGPASKDAVEEKKAAPDAKKVDSMVDSAHSSEQQNMLSGDAADATRARESKPTEVKSVASASTKTEPSKKKQELGKSDSKSGSKASEEKKPTTAKRTIKKTTASVKKEEKVDEKKIEKSAVVSGDAKKEVGKATDKANGQKVEKAASANASAIKEVPAEKKAAKEVKTEKKEPKQKSHVEEDVAGSRKRKENKEKVSKLEGEPVDKKAKEKETKDIKPKDKSDVKVVPKKDKVKIERNVKKDDKKESSASKDKQKEEAKAAPDEKGYNLQDNKDDIQVIDVVEGSASDGSVHNDDDVLSRHSGSDFEEMSSRSGSFSRSKSPLSGRSWSRSRSFSGGSSDSFEKVEKAKKEERRKRARSNERDEETSGVKSKIARALTADNQKALDECLKSAKYFIIKSNNYENVALSKAKGVWSTPPANERKLNDAYRHAANVILIFSVKESGRFQGFCRLASESRRDGPMVRWVLPPGFDRKILTGVFKVDWLNRHECLFANCTHLRNPWNDNKEIKICRDGQEVEPTVGEELCKLFPPDEHVELARLLRHRKHERMSSNRSRSGRHEDGRQRDGGSSSHQRRYRDSSGYRRKRRHSDDFDRDGRSKYGVKKETLLHGSYADYIREFEKSRQLRQSFGAMPAAMAHYHQPQPRYRSVDPTTAAAEAFLSRGYTSRQQYRSRR